MVPVDSAVAPTGEASADGLGPDTGRGKGGFEVHLDVFEGPFDLLLSLIAKKRLDVTLVALSKVTDEFVGYIRERGDDWDLDTASEFLVVAATLLDLKVARLLPSAEADEEDLALLEARDLLFARLLQYRAYKDVVDVIRTLMDSAALRYPRLVPLEPQFAGLLPEVQLGVGPQEFAELAARAMAPRPVPVVDIGHLHAPLVSVREQAAIIAERLRGSGAATFRALISDCPDTMTVVGRFLAVLELYREGVVAFDQVTPLGELHVRWVGGEGPSLELGEEIDSEYDVVDADE
ncbi:MAG TPA: segregation/condensation protein A [Mycobacteriales bacterium]|jgi:segregation and condensation protein A|nr:segregation/condensation protein A [Mycobacteriales bacterium]